MSDMKSTRLTIRINPELRQRLRRQASLTGVSESELVRSAVAYYLAESGPRLTCYDLVRRAGLIGAVKNAPADLSTNRDYFYGSGS